MAKDPGFVADICQDGPPEARALLARPGHTPESEGVMSEGKTYYPTIKAARAALALDSGFDPFISGGWGRPTKAKLAEAGYPVDPKKCREAARERERRRRAGLCSVCGRKALTRLMCSAHGIGNCGRCEPESTGRCKAHTEWSLQCDEGHHWRSTDAGSKCPTCGGYAV